MGPVPVSADTVTLVQTMLAAWEWTDFWCDASVLPAVEAAGYDADFLVVSSREEMSLSTVAIGKTPGLAGVVCSLEDLTVTLPHGVRLDPGGIGKGLAGDLVVQDLLSFGAQGALLDVGGDLSMGGVPGVDRPWNVELPEGNTLVVPSNRCSGVATSSTKFRRWAGGHHLVDPTTGMPSQAPVAMATSVAPTAWQAEAASKVALLNPDAAGWFARMKLWARVEYIDGDTSELGSRAQEVLA